ncbi:MAG TPA: hypothetical protein VFV64_00640 [Permianibacter sp.]|nr:hypothetical protein [Permianibacter sp.]
METSAEPLKYPSHYPPTDRWKKFFIGVRWLGPDLSFFKELKQNQAARTSIQMNAWGGGKRQEIAQRISEILVKRLKWHTAVFIPNDSLAVVVNGPQFDLIDDFVLEEIIEDAERAYQIELETCKLTAVEPTFGDLVDLIITTIEEK